MSEKPKYIPITDETKQLIKLQKGTKSYDQFLKEKFGVPQ